jgi:hypothetical protein
MKKIITHLAIAFCLNGWAQCSSSINAEYNIICNSQNDLLIASIADSYTWQPTASIIQSSISGDTIVVQPTTSTIYTLTSTTGTCVATNTISITVNNCTPPKAGFTKTADTICAHTCINFKDTSQLHSTKPLFYSWVFVGAGMGTGQISPPSGSTVSGDTLHYTLTSNTVFPNVKVCYNINSLSSGNGYYPVIEYVKNGIGQTSIYKDSVRVVPGPSVNFNLVKDTIPQTWDIYPNYTTYSSNLSAIWNWGDGTSTSGLYPSHIYSTAGRYYISVTVSDMTGCSSTTGQSDTVFRYTNNSSLNSMVYINIKNNATGISKVADVNSAISIYPNPSNGNFVIETNATTKQTLQVYDVNGRIVLTQTINGKTTIDASFLPNGIYNVSIISNEGIANKRIVIGR